MRLRGSGIHHRSKLHRSSMRDTCCHSLPRRTATGSCSGPSRTATGIGIERGLMASSPEGSMETCTVRISGAGCQGATSTTLYRACLPFMRAWSCRSTSTSRRCRSCWASGKRPICTPAAPEERFGEDKGHRLHGGLGVVGLQLAPDNAGRPLPIAHGLLEVDRLLPGGCAKEGAAEGGLARVPAPDAGPGVGPLEEGVYRRQQELHRGGGEGKRGTFDDGLLVLQGNQGAVVDAAREVPRFGSRRPELVCKDVPSSAGRMSLIM